MKNLTLLDRILNLLDSKKFEKGLYFICFVFTPIYLIGHIVFALVQGRI